MIDLSNENIIHIKNNNIEYIQFKKLLKYKNIKHCFTLKPLDFAGANTYFENKEKVDESYKELCDELNIKFEELCRPKQTHTDRVEIIEDGDEGIYNEKFNDVDGLITNKNNKALILSFADCTPLIFFDPIKNIVANTHSGWRGTLQKIGTKTIKKMNKEYNSNPADIICCIGPHIRKCHFEVESDVKDMFLKVFKDIINIEQYIEEKNNRFYIDTVEINKQMLIKLGLKEENIIDSEICTVCNREICHSYRAEKEQSGRSISLIELTK